MLSARCERPYLHGGVVREDVPTRTQQDELVLKGVLANELGIELGMMIRRCGNSGVDLEHGRRVKGEEKEGRRKSGARIEGIVIGFLFPPDTVERERVVPHRLSKGVSRNAIRNSEHIVATIVILVDVGVKVTLSRSPRVLLRIVAQIGLIHVKGAVSTAYPPPLVSTEWSMSFRPKKRRKRGSPH